MTERGEVRRLLVALEELLGFPVRAGFKPDFMTMLGINTGNEWGLPPTLYKAADVHANVWPM